MPEKYRELVDTPELRRKFRHMLFVEWEKPQVQDAPRTTSKGAKSLPTIILWFYVQGLKQRYAATLGGIYGTNLKLLRDKIRNRRKGDSNEK